MEHTEYYLLVDGAEEASIIVDADDKVISNGDAGSSPESGSGWLESIIAEHPDWGYGKLWEVYQINHGDHDLHDECECIQYATAHHPIWSSAE